MFSKCNMESQLINDFAVGDRKYVRTILTSVSMTTTIITILVII